MRMRRLAMLVAVGCGLLGGCLEHRAPELHAGQGHWISGVPLLTPRADVGAAALDGKLFVVGGTTQGDPKSALLEVFDPKIGRWVARAPLPSGMSHVGVAALSHRLYVFGGFTAVPHANAQKLAFVYDPDRDQWQSLPDLGAARGSIVAVVLDNRIHLLGGRGLDKATVATHEVFDPRTNTYTSAAPMSRSRDHLGATVIAGKIHIFGGRSDGPTDNLNLHEVYDPSSNSWTTASPLPTARSDGATAVLADVVIYAGGECTGSPPSKGSTFAAAEGFDARGSSWVALAPLPAARHSFQAATLGSRAYFVGGFRNCAGGGLTDEVLVLDLNSDRSVT